MWNAFLSLLVLQEYGLWTLFKRYWWLVWIGTSLVACMFSIVTMYRKWDANPVTIVYGAELEPISTVPFPAVTICPLVKSRIEEFNLTQAFEVVNQNATLDERSESKLRTLAHVCAFKDECHVLKKSRKENVILDLRAMAHSLKEVIAHCWWRSSVVPCESLMMERLVDDGICYTFNSLALDEIYRDNEISPDFLNFTNTAPTSDWTREYGYRPGAGLRAYPNRPLTNGIISGVIMVAVMRSVDHEPLCSGTYTGFKFAVHAPDEVAFMDDRFYRLDTLNAVILDLTPNVIKASGTLRNLSPLKRNCYFSDEKYLRFFKIYNQVNCVSECISNYTLASCGCVKFSMPRSTDTKICDVAKIDCYRSSFLTLYEKMVNAYIAGESFNSCNCLPSCSTVDYEVGISHDNFNFHEFPMKLNFINEKIDPSLVFVAFGDRHYTYMVRRELIGINRAVAELGGLFALLMGSSMLSLAEIVYFCCIRQLRREQPRKSKQIRAKRAHSRRHRVHLRVDPWAIHQ